jgi:NDP-sugar pyrophosphorylase family protein
MTDRLSGAIIAAGRGERLRAASGGLPKPLVELGGQTLLMRQVEALIRLGASPIHVIVNSETAALINQRRIRLPDLVGLTVADTPNSMESLLTLGEKIAPGQFILSTVDAILTGEELASFASRARDAIALRSLDGALGVVRWRGDQRPLFVEVADDGMITRFADQSGTLVTAGVYVFSTNIFAQASAARGLRLDALRRFLGMLTENGLRFAAIELTGVVDLDEAADLDLARALIARRTRIGAF